MFVRQRRIDVDCHFTRYHRRHHDTIEWFEVVGRYASCNEPTNGREPGLFCKLTYRRLRRGLTVARTTSYDLPGIWTEIVVGTSAQNQMLDRTVADTKRMQLNDIGTDV